jgi:hypothetical protein
MGRVTRELELRSQARGDSRRAAGFAALGSPQASMLAGELVLFACVLWQCDVEWWNTDVNLI